MKKELKQFLLTCPLALITLLIPSLYGDNQLVAVILLSVVSVLMLLVNLNYKYLIFFFAVFISGPVAEAIAIYFGAWTYTSVIFVGVPAWLPFVWGNAGLYIARLHALIYSLK